jgi:Tol biopolymer transport system component
VIDLALSADGRVLVYPSATEGGALYARRLDQLEGVRLIGTEGAVNPILSPDGAWVAYDDSRNDSRMLKKISTAGGVPVPLCEVPGLVTGGAWTRDGHILFAVYGGVPGLAQGQYGLYQVHENGGEALLLTAPPKGQFALYRWPHLLPGERTVLFSVYRGIPSSEAPLFDESETMALSLDQAGAEPRSIGLHGSHAQYAASGHLLIGSAGGLLAVPFDPDRLEVRGNPVRVATGVRQKVGTFDFALSPGGALVYLSAGTAGSGERELVWVDAEGREEPVAAPPHPYDYPRLSPDGQRVAFSLNSEGQADLWSWDLERGAMRKLTFDSTPESFPTWTPDGRDLVFASGGEGGGDLYRMPIDGTGAPQLLLDAQDSLPLAVSPDGRHLVHLQGGVASVLDLTAPEDAPTPLGIADIWSADFSPDGRFLAYDVGGPARDSQIHVVTFPDPRRGRWQITVQGGRDPVWSRDGSEIYYRPNGINVSAIMAVEIRTSPAFTAGRPRERLRLDYYRGLRRSFDVAPGPRFLILRRAGELDPRTQPQVVLVNGFLDELRRLVPVD